METDNKMDVEKTAVLGDIIEKYYPGLSDEEANNLLLNATCFPFGSFAQVEENLKELVEKTDGTVEGAIDFSHKQMGEAMIAFGKKNEQSKKQFIEAVHRWNESDKKSDDMCDLLKDTISSVETDNGISFEQLKQIVEEHLDE